MTYAEIFKTLKKKFQECDKLGYINLGDDDNPCYKHLEITLNKTNSKAWKSTYRLLCESDKDMDNDIKRWKHYCIPTIFIGRQGNKKNYSFIIAVGTQLAGGGYFHLYSDDTYFDGNIEFDTDEEYNNMLVEFLNKVVEMLN